MSEHFCHALGCSVRVAPRLLMCPRHWRMVPTDLQQDVCREYRPGQERDKEPSPEYIRAAYAALCAVADQEGVPVPRWLRVSESRELVMR